MSGATITLTWLHFVVLLANCVQLAPLPSTSQGPSIDAVSVVSSGWPAAIVVRRADQVETGLVPEASDFPNSTFIEFGWGDRASYPARKTTLGMTLDAALRPTPAVMYMAGYARPPKRIHRAGNSVSAAMPREVFRHMVKVLAGYFDREERGRLDIFVPGPLPHSNLYPAYSRFHLFNNCNMWTARVLRAGREPLAGRCRHGRSAQVRLRATLSLNRPSGTGM